MIAALDIARLKPLDTTTLRPLFPRSPPAPPMLSATRVIRTVQEKRQFATLRNAQRAAATIRRIPSKRESVHLVLRANYFAPFDVLPAFCQLAGEPAREVFLCSLGINGRHIQALDGMLASGTIRQCSILLSDYFSKVDADEYQHAVAVIEKHGGRVAARRSHAKLILARFAGGTHLVCESSGNLRSCRSIEQCTVFNSRSLFRFHKKWILEMLAQ